MAFEVARDASMAPVVIYIDECDQVEKDNNVLYTARPFSLFTAGIHLSAHQASLAMLWKEKQRNLQPASWLGWFLCPTKYL